jgi:hypothetical protein
MPCGVVRRRRVAPLVVWCVALASLSTAAAGCRRAFSGFDGGPRPPAEDAGPTDIDTDGDGLCDGQELSRGLRADNADTDADGYSDFAEVSLGDDPTLPSSPDRERLVFLSEASMAAAEVAVAMPVLGAGEVYQGAFQSLSQVYPDDQSAGSYFAGGTAVGATPGTQVFRVEPEAQRFVGVQGRTLLVFRVQFAYQGPVRGCLRAYPFLYSLKREDGRIVGQRRYTLVVVPDGGRPGESTWCGASPCW